MSLEKPLGSQGLNTAPVPSTKKGNHKDKEQNISDRRFLSDSRHAQLQERE